MTKDEWVAAAAEKLKPYLGDKAQEYAEGLYETYDNGDNWTPEDAVDEDMSYWGD
jgi:hypothetical protein